jgi:hypothetical protein
MPTPCRTKPKKLGSQPPRFISAYSIAKPIAAVAGVVNCRTPAYAAGWYMP